MAKIDQANGRYEYQVYGLPVPYVHQVRMLLRDRYNVELRVAGGCVMWPHELWCVSGYNNSSLRFLEMRYGKDVVEECFKVAAEQHKAKQRPGE